jgi:hypothetical protein
VRSQEKGELQVTIAVDSRQSMGTNLFMKFQFGLIGRLQLSAEVPYGKDDEDMLSHATSWNLPKLGFEYQIIRGREPFSLAAGIALEPPFGSIRKTEWEPTVMAARALGRLQVHVSVSSTIQAEHRSFEFDVASVYPVHRIWFPTLEFTGKQVRGIQGFYLTPGWYRHFKHRLEFGIGDPLAIGGRSPRFGIVTKLNWEIGGNRGHE